MIKCSPASQSWIIGKYYLLLSFGPIFGQFVRENVSPFCYSWQQKRNYLVKWTITRYSDLPSSSHLLVSKCFEQNDKNDKQPETEEKTVTKWFISIRGPIIECRTQDWTDSIIIGGCLASLWLTQCW